MHVAKRKRKENIIEFVLYMLQVQDVIRAYELNKESIELKLLSKYKCSKVEFQELKEWYFGLVDQLASENKYKEGTLQSILNILNEVNELHLWFLNEPEYRSYKQLFESIQPYLLEYQLKTKSKAIHDIELAVTLIYSYVLLKMKGETILDETQNAVKEVSAFLNKLSRYYVEYEKGNIQVV